MARETKVGLIVGLGVILFVSVFVSDYISAPHPEEAWADADLSNFHEGTTNQPQLVRSSGDQPAQHQPIDTDRLAAVVLDQFERRDGYPIDQPTAERLGEPPHRDGLYTPALPVDEPTPIAHQPFGVNQVDDLGHARDGQLANERIGPGADPIEHLTRVNIADPPAITLRAQQVEHIVKRGENLTTIARKHYNGDGNMWRSIRDANPGKVSTKGEIVEGARLIIPKRSAQADDPLTSFPTEAISGSTDGPTRQRVRIITVKDGQTLSAIAAEHLGSARKWQLIMDVNTDVLDKPENLRAGMKLRVPAEPVVELIETANDALAERERETTPQPPRETRAKTYTVKAGDSLYKIAEKQLGDGERFNEIYETNRDKLSSADAIRAGMKLTLPKR